MLENNIVSLDDYRKKLYKRASKNTLMDISKVDLLEQLLLFYEDVKKDPFDVRTALYGEDLMEAIADRSLTRELHDLAELYLNRGPQAAFSLDPVRPQ